MTPELKNTIILELREYAKRLHRLGYSPKRASDLRLNHAYWVCLDIIGALESVYDTDYNDPTLPYRIGFVRGVLYDSKIAWAEDILALPDVC